MSEKIRKFQAFLKDNETAKGLLLIGIVLLGAVAVWGGIRFALNTEYPILVVSSGSMCRQTACTLPVGALILIRGQDPSTIQKGPPCGQVAVGPGASGGTLGSIIVFRPYLDNPDYLVVHRIRDIIPTSTGNSTILNFKTEGDNFETNPGCDGWNVQPNQIVGVYQYTIPIPYLGNSILAIRDFMGTPQGVLVVVALIVALFALEIIEPSKKGGKAVAEATERTSVEDAPLSQAQHRLPCSGR